MRTEAKSQKCGNGYVIFHVQDGNEAGRFRFQDVLHIPQFRYSLLSVSRMDQKGFGTIFGSK